MDIFSFIDNVNEHIYKLTNLSYVHKINNCMYLKQKKVR